MMIDPEFQALLPPLTDDEKRVLEEDIRQHGCIDPLATWQGLLIGGYNRYEICERLHIEYTTVEIELPDRDAARIWIITNQLGRRNLEPFQRAELVHKLKPLLKAKAKAKQR